MAPPSISDLFTQPGANLAPLTEGDILGPSEAMRQGMPDYFAAGPNTKATLTRRAADRRSDVSAGPR